MATPSFRTEYEAYTLGKMDFMNAISTGAPLTMSLTEGEQRDTSLVRKWVQGCNHAELAVRAHAPVAKIQAQALVRATTKKK